MIKAFIIRLEENEHSCKMAEDCFNRALENNVQPFYFKAVHANNVDFHYDKTGIVKAGKFKKNRAGVSGCFFSHYYLWQKCLELDEPIMILEHDGYLIRKYNPEWLDYFQDVLKLDRHDPFSNKYNEAIEEEISNPVRIEYYKNNYRKKNLHKFKITNYFKGAYSYIIKPKAVRKLNFWIRNNGHRPADQQLAQPILSLKTTTPTVARLHPFYAIGNNINSESLTRNL